MGYNKIGITFTHKAITMTGYNMPPGCSPEDIPGNGPEDQYWEAVHEKIAEALGKFRPLVNLTDTMLDDMIGELQPILIQIQQDGYGNGQDDERLYQSERKV